MQQQSKKRGKNKKQKEEDKEEEQEDEKEDEKSKEKQEEDTEMSGPTPIEQLVEKGINSGDIKKLKEAGYHTVESVLFTPFKALILVKGLSENKVEKIVKACQELKEWGFQNATDYFNKRKSLVFITTGSKNLGKIYHSYKFC